MRSLSSPCKKSQGMRQAYQSNRDTHFLQYTNKNSIKKNERHRQGQIGGLQRVETPL